PIPAGTTTCPRTAAPGTRPNDGTVEAPRVAVRSVRSELEIEDLVPPPEQPPGERASAAIDLGEAAEARFEHEVRVLHRDDHFIDGGQGLGAARLGVGLRGDLAFGHVGQLGGDLVALARRDLRDDALISRLA